MKKVITIGEIVVEIMAEESGIGFRSALPLIGPFASGAPAIFVDQVAKLEQPCGIISAVGKDDFGALNMEQLRNDGVDVSAISVHPTATTGSAFVRYRPDGNRDFIFNIRHSACASINLTVAAEQLIGSANHLHIMGSALFSNGIISAIREATDRIKRRFWICRVCARRSPMRLITPIFSCRVARKSIFSPRRSRTKYAVAELLKRSVKVVVLKRGAEGASYFDKTGTFFAPAFKAEEIDPTGVGDSFGAAFVTCWLRGMDPRQALTIANAAGARAVGVKGPMEGTSTMAEIKTFLNKHRISA